MPCTSSRRDDLCPSPSVACCCRRSWGLGKPIASSTASLSEGLVKGKKKFPFVGRFRIQNHGNGGPKQRVSPCHARSQLSNEPSFVELSLSFDAGTTFEGRFRGPDHLHGPQQGSDRLKLFESFADHPGFGRIGRVVRELLRHTCMHHTIAKSAN